MSELRMMRVKEVAIIMGMSVQNVWLLARKGTIPKPIKYSSRITVWRSDEIQEHIEQHAVRLQG